MEKRWIWPFELEEKIGEGGMGVVYRGRYVKDNRRVAVKLLPSDVVDETIFARFEREVEVLKTLRHPNIVRCFGGTNQEHQRFYAMELLNGGTLADILREQGRLPWPKVVEYGTQICSALFYAHSRGVVHRDIKPSNFLIADDGTLKLSDFGLVLVRSEMRLTEAGRTMGTVHYMAPEQLNGKHPLSARTDLYALGCVLFEMLTGRPPFTGKSPAETMHQHIKTPAPRVSQLTTLCPTDLEQLVADLLEKDPAKRPESAAVVAQRMKNLDQAVVLKTERAPLATSVPTSDETASAPAIVTHSRTAIWPLGIAAAIIVGLGVWIVQLRQHNESAGQAEAMWIETFQSPNPELKRAGAEALAKLAPTSERALQALMKATETGDAASRLEAIAALGRSGTGSTEVMAHLRVMQRKDADEHIRQAAGSAYNQISTSPAASDGSGVLVLFGVMALMGLGGVVLVIRWAMP